MPPRHFLTGTELSPAELEALLERAAALKQEPLSCDALAGRSVALIFEKPSTTQPSPVCDLLRRGASGWQRR